MKSKLLPMLFASLMSLAHPIPGQESLGPELDALKAQYDLRVKNEVQQPYDAAVADLNVKYTASLERGLESAQRAGRLDEALAMKNEKEAIATGDGVPATDEGKIAPALKQLRDVYRTSLGRLDADRAKRLQPLQAAFAKSFDAVIARLTTEGKLEQAQAARRLGDALAAAAKGRLINLELLTSSNWKYTGANGLRIWTFNPDNTITSSTGATGQWSVTDNLLRTKFSTGVSEYTLERSGGDFILKCVYSSASKVEDLTLTRSPK